MSIEDRQRDGAELEGPGVVYEVFARREPHGAYVEQGSFVAGSPEMALVLARENFLRRGPIYGLWVVPRAAIAILEDGDELFRGDKTYREVGDYQYLIEKWRHYHQHAMTPDTMA